MYKTVALKILQDLAELYAIYTVLWLFRHIKKREFKYAMKASRKF